jgi:hypothetical protein
MSPPSRRILRLLLGLWKICVPFWEANVAEVQRGRVLGKRLSEHQGDGWILDRVLMKPVLKIGGGWKGLMLAVLNVRIMLFEYTGCVAVVVEQR